MILSFNLRLLWNSFRWFYLSISIYCAFYLHHTYLQNFFPIGSCKSPDVSLSRILINFAFLPTMIVNSGSISARMYYFTTHLTRMSAISDLHATRSARRSPVASEAVTAAICNHRCSRVHARIIGRVGAGGIEDVRDSSHARGKSRRLVGGR